MNQDISHPNGLKNKSRNFGIFLYLPFIISVLINNPGLFNLLLTPKRYRVNCY